MPLYAGVCETNITPPPGIWMCGYAGRPTGANGIHDELYARALTLDNGKRRLALVAMDLVALDPDIVERVRAGIATQTNIPIEAVMLHCTHTHGGPYVRSFRDMGQRDAAYINILKRKLIGVACQAMESLRPAHLTYGESPAQIGVNRRQSLPDGKVVLGNNYGGPVSSLVQCLCVQGLEGRTFAMLFCHACHPTTLGGANLRFTADWPGAAVAHLKRRFQKDGADTGIAEDALPFCLQGCSGDINPLKRDSWEAMETNGRIVADAAHTARWNAHGRMQETLEAVETTVELALLGQAEESVFPFTIQRFTVGGVQILGFPAEMFVRYGLDFSAQSPLPVMSLGYTNGCWNYVPTAAEYTRGGYEVEEAHTWYRTPMFSPECEPILRDATYRLLGIEDPDRTPYPIN